eukprot:GHVU01204674.1.p1 GENE.GHVU01204674.1~~GHVU01204674.1.p1  ORF type:complete len:115 (+),score=3.95 GHVU01204674.1:260-604(+)
MYVCMGKRTDDGSRVSHHRHHRLHNPYRYRRDSYRHLQRRARGREMIPQQRRIISSSVDQPNAHTSLSMIRSPPLFCSFQSSFPHFPLFHFPTNHIYQSSFHLYIPAPLSPSLS